MKNFKIIDLEALQTASLYEPVEAGIYKVLDTQGYADYRMAMSMEMEDGDDSQYPLEDILDKFLVHVEDFLETDDPKCPRYVFGGELEGIQKLKTLVGKRAFNQEYDAEDGRRLIKLVIE